MTSKEYIMVRKWMNQFSDRWPDDYYRLHNSQDTKDPNWWQNFQVTILRKYINRAKTDHEDTLEILSLIHALKREYCDNRRKIKQEVSIEDISTGEL